MIERQLMRRRGSPQCIHGQRTALFVGARK